MKNSKKWVKWGLSAFIVFHSYVILIAPNNQSYLGMKSFPVLDPYMGIFEFATTWCFFAPEPGPPPIFIEYELIDSTGNSLGISRFPDDPDPYPFWFRERQNRRINLARFMGASDDRAVKMMVPYLCKKDSRVNSIKLWRILYPEPSMPEVLSGQRKIGDGVGMDRHWVSENFCKEFQS